MKGYRFYQEFKDIKRIEPTGNCVAWYVDNPSLIVNGQTLLPSASAVFHWGANASCRFSFGALAHLRIFCKRVSEATAREIHPKLFEYLEAA